MDGQKSEKVTDRREIRGRQRKFIAFCTVLLLACLPTANAFAASVTIEGNGPTGDPRDSNIQANVGKKLNPSETEQIIFQTTSGRLEVYFFVNGVCVDEKPDGNYTTDGPFSVAMIRYHDVDYWEIQSLTPEDDTGTYWKKLKVNVVGKQNAPAPSPKPEPAVTPKPEPAVTPTTDPTPAADPTPAVNPEAGKKSGEKKEDKEDKEDRDNTPFINNPDALSAVYHDKTGKHAGAKFGKETQGPACDLGFQNKRPDGWKKGITFSMSVNDKHTFDLKNGTLDLYVPENLQKKGREYAIMGIDKEGNVIVFYDTDKTNPYLVKADIELEGYAFELIYRDTAQT